MSGIEYIPKPPIEKARGRFSKKSKENVRVGAKNKRSYFKKHPLEENEFYVKLILKDKVRHIKADEIQVSLDADSWFKIPGIVEKLRK